MKVLNEIAELKIVPGPTHLAIGVFDGVHLGHQAVIARARESAKLSGGSSVAVTFHPHPVRVLRPEKAPRLLTSTQHKIRLIRSLGADALLILEFTPKFSRTRPERFIEDLAEGSNQLRQICVGKEWCFGANRSGSVRLLEELSPKLGFELGTVAPVLVGEQVVSSTLIRSAIERGALEFANLLLGRQFTILGTVSEGKKLGTRLGYPTANLRAHNEQFPPNGVYAAKAWFAGKEYGGVVNIGVRPTLEYEGGERLLELHLFDFNQDIYGQDVEVAFLRYLRPEQKFSGTEELRAQIGRDTDNARQIYGGSK
jgi:riboflavin kinase/FMN adenylyltransferase